MSGRATKRRRTNNLVIGVPSEADSPSNQAAPTSLAYARRRVTTVQPLTTICAQIFVWNFAKLSSDRHSWVPNDQWGPTSEWLKVLPDKMLPPIFTMLRSSCPHLLTADLVRDYFLRGNVMTLSSSLGGGRIKGAVSALPTMGSGLVSLTLIGFDKIQDSGFSHVVSRLPSLQALKLSGCTKAGPKTIEALVKHCRAVSAVNLNYTSVTPVTLAPLFLARKSDLQVLKFAGIPSWTDSTFNKLLTILSSENDFLLPALQSLKLRQTALSDVSLTGILSFCPNLRRLDISFTAVKHLSAPVIASFAQLEKLSLTSTHVSGDDLCSILLGTSHLSTLAIGALGGSRGQSSAMGNDTALTMTDDTLDALTDILSGNTHIRNINLVGNSKLGRRKDALPRFIGTVGRRLKSLNMVGITSLHSSDLSTLVSDGAFDEHPSLEVLSLSRTGVDDDAAPYIATCTALQTLEVGSTRFTSEGLFSIIDECPKLSNIDITSCRGIGVVARRRFFEVKLAFLCFSDLIDRIHTYLRSGRTIDLEKHPHDNHPWKLEEVYVHLAHRKPTGEL
ncbi:hypothetical protein OF83DRAFT_1050847 [Amylostereum chailletii]|nr:hypothetical protein OF83DRAFT_1050847 [Amylostereum chailletii]